MAETNRKLTVSPYGIYHRVNRSGFATFCGIDLSDLRRKHWHVWDGILEDDVVQSNMCLRCSPGLRPPIPLG